jgi:hypothetical protein
MTAPTNSALQNVLSDGLTNLAERGSSGSLRGERPSQAIGEKSQPFGTHVGHKVRSRLTIQVI